MVCKYKVIFYFALSSGTDYYVTEYNYDSIFDVLFDYYYGLHTDYQDCFKFEVLKIYEK